MLTGPYFYQFDTKSVPGKIVCHGVRFESLEIEVIAFEKTTLNVLSDGHPELKTAGVPLKIFRRVVVSNFKPCPGAQRKGSQT